MRSVGGDTADDGLGLALSGGAARALTHIGVVSVLAEHRIHPTAIAATSGGAIIGAALASGLPPDELAEVACRLSWRRLARFAFSKHALLQLDRLEALIGRLVPARSFDELVVPLRVVATDVNTGERVVLEDGPLVPSLMASCAIPGVFPPVRLNNRLLVDGAVSCNLPTDVVRQMGVGTVLAVDATADVSGLDAPSHLLQVVAQSVYLMSRRLTEHYLADADLVVAPQMASIGWQELHKAPEIIEAGRREMEAQIPKLLEAHRPENWWRRLRRKNSKQ